MDKNKKSRCLIIITIIFLLCGCSSNNLDPVEFVPVQKILNKTNVHIKQEETIKNYVVQIDADVNTHSAKTLYKITLTPNAETLKTDLKKGIEVGEDGTFIYTDPDESHQYYGDSTIDDNYEYGFFTSSIPNGLDIGARQVSDTVLDQINELDRFGIRGRQRILKLSICLVAMIFKSNCRNNYTNAQNEENSHNDLMKTCGVYKIAFIL